jgi:hypothetical protein
MRKKKTKINQYRKKFLMIKIIFAALVIGLFSLGGSAVAKYYSNQKQKGVAVASKFYFTSNILRTGVQYTDGIPTSITEYTKTGGWLANIGSGQTQSTDITFEVRNYENNLQYNDENIQVTYDVYAMLVEEAGTDITYNLIKNNTESTQNINNTTPKKIYESEKLNGGSVNKNSYTLSYKSNPGVTALPVDVLIWIVPTGPDYISADNNTMGCRFKVSNTTEEFQLMKGFNLELTDAQTPMTAEEKRQIKSQAAFIYTVSTSGSYEGGDTIPVTLSWDSRYLQLDKFSRYNENVTSVGDINSVAIDMEQYSSIQLTFYRTQQFSSFIEDENVSTNMFLNLIAVNLRGE